MIGYYCAACTRYFLETDLIKGNCPECKSKTNPRLVLGGQVIGAKV